MNNRIANRFRVGVRIRCAKDMWKSLESQYPEALHATRSQIADDVGTDYTSLVKWENHGKLSLELLLVFLISSKWKYSDLGDMAKRDELILDGIEYAAKTFIKHRSPCNTTLGRSELFHIWAWMYGVQMALQAESITEFQASDLFSGEFENVSPPQLAAITSNAEKYLEGFSLSLRGPSSRQNIWVTRRFESTLRTWGVPVVRCLRVLNKAWRRWGRDDK